MLLSKTINRFVLGALLVCAAACADEKKSDALELTFEQEHATAAISVVENLLTNHYISLELDDNLSKKTLTKYLDTLDPTRSYFSQADIAEFSKWQFLIDDYLKRGDLSPAFTIYNRYLEKAEKRYESNIELLNSDYEFVFDSDETLLIDYEDTPWLESEESIDQVWIKRLTDSLLRLKLSEKTTEEARETLTKRYERLITRLNQRNSNDIFELFMNSLTLLFDPHTSYMSPKSLEDFKISLSLSLEGIGAVLQSAEEHTQVVRVIPGGPADKQGILKPEDKIISVAQDEEELVDVVGWRLDEVVELIRGSKDTTVRLEILSPTSSTPKVISIVRDKIKLEEQSAKSEIIDIQGDGTNYKFGVISVPAFYLDWDAIRKREKDVKSTSGDVLKLIDKLEKESIDGLILDLRNNGGGYLSEATRLTDLFIDQGPVVQVKDANQRISRNQRARNPARYAGPLLVLTNRLSASASEITAGAIQDYGRGLVVGGTTFGKGTVQARSPVEDGELKITESKFYRVSGGSTQHKGVVPDIQFPTFYDYEQLGESSYDHALPWDTIIRVPHRVYSNFQPVLPVLINRHEKRLASDPDLIHLKQVTSFSLKKRKSLKTISLNLEKRKAESDENDQQLLSLENERRLRKSQEPYDSHESWKKATEEPDTLPLPVRDPILYEAGNILADIQRIDSSLAKAR